MLNTKAPHPKLPQGTPCKNQKCLLDKPEPTSVCRLCKAPK